MDDKFKEWDKQLAEVDRAMAQKAGKPTAAPAPKPGPSPGALPAPAARALSGKPPGRGVGVWVRTGLTAVLVAALAVWPFAHPCGLTLAAYFGALGVGVGSGLWAMVSSWQRRMPKAHTLAMLTVVGALVLAALEVLPRIGYAKQTLEWICR